MKTKMFFLLAVVAILGIIGTGCETDGGSGNNSWKHISAFNDLAGTWEGSFTVNVPSKGDYHEMIATIFDVPVPATTVFFEYYIMEYEEDSAVISTKSKMVYDKLLEDTVKLNTGYTKDSLWNNLVSFYEPLMDYMNITIGKYYITAEFIDYVHDLPISAFALDSEGERLQMTVPLSPKYRQEVIFIKK